MRNVLFAALAASVLHAGGFFITLGNPSAHPETKTTNAVLIARLTGCHEPEKATLTGTAEGIVHGKRQSIPLSLVALSAPGTYAVLQQWPEEGDWIVRLEGYYPEMKAKTGVIVKVKGNTFERAGAKFVTHAPTAGEVDSLLGITE